MLEKIFKFKERETNVLTEVTAGVTTFITMAYIIFVNPEILSMAMGQETKEALIVVTCLASAFGTILVAFWGNLPIAMAPGMGLNAFFTFSLVLGKGIPWEKALGIVFISGVIFLILTMLKIREKIVDAIPSSIRLSIAAGIGLFVAFIGLKGMGLIVDNEATLVSMGKIIDNGSINKVLLLGLVGFFIMGILEIKNVKGGILLGIVITTVLGVFLGVGNIPEGIVSMPPSIGKIAFKLDIIGALNISFIGAIFSFMFLDLFDSLGTIIACAKEAGLENEKGEIEGLVKTLETDAMATVVGALLGTSTTTAYVESGAGIADGGRTGFTSIVVGVLFLLSIFFTPMIQIVPSYATSPALLIVGIYMFKNLIDIDLHKIDIAIPCFLTIIMMPLTYSISTGISFGFISYVIIELFTGKAKDVKPLMWIIALLSVLSLILS